MLVSESITRIRRTLRDRDGDVFTDTTIIRLWNKTLMKFCRETGILERQTHLPVPPMSHSTYTHRWEEEYTSRPSSLLYSFLSPFTYTQPWEPCSVVGTSPEPTGGYTITQGWESHYVDTFSRVRHYFPDDYLSPIFIAYDEKPIEWVFRREVAEGNTSFTTKAGDYPSIYIEDNESLVFYLYPKVTANYGCQDLVGDYGVLIYDDSSTITLDSDYGVIIFTEDDDISGNYGVTVRYQTPEDAIYLVYQVKPLEIADDGQTIEVPKWSVKYIEAGVLSLLFKMESDLQSLPLSEHFEGRYEAGVKITEHFKSKQRTMRGYKFRGPQYKQGQRRKLADLPSHYPSYWR